MSRVGMEVSVAIGEAVRLCDVDVVAAYPITPQTHIVEHIADLVANSKLEAAFIPVESEHSALSSCLGASAAGARTFTATAGQGLELMHEVVYVASSMQLPVVMAVANRALSSPLSVWGDHSDAMAVRDTGWIQIFTENGQEVVDQVICAFRIAEDQRVLLPVMIHLDGFHLSHMIEPITLPEKKEVENFLPPYRYPNPLDPARPVSMGCFAPPVIYPEMKKAQEEHLRASKAIILECWEEFYRSSGRRYQPVETYHADGARILLLLMGSFAETAMAAVDEMEGVGVVRIRLWRPFPFEELYEAVKDADTLIVLDRAISFGGPGGPVASEVKSALFGKEKRPKVASIISGLGGRDINIENFKEIIRRGVAMTDEGIEASEIMGVRE